MPIKKVARHSKYEEVVFPMPLGYTKEEWDEKINEYMEKEKMEGESLVSVKYSEKDTHVIFWTEKYVVCIQSTYEESYNGNFDDFDDACLPRNF